MVCGKRFSLGSHTIAFKWEDRKVSDYQIEAKHSVAVSGLKHEACLALNVKVYLYQNKIQANIAHDHVRCTNKL